MRPFYNFVDWTHLANYHLISMNLIQVCGFMKRENLLFVGTAHLQGKTSDLSIVTNQLKTDMREVRVPLWLLSCHMNSMTSLSMRSRSSVDSFPRELVSFVRPRELVSFDPRQVTRSPPIGKYFWVVRYNKIASFDSEKYELEWGGHFALLSKFGYFCWLRAIAFGEQSRLF